MKEFYWADVIGLWYYIWIHSCCRACHWSHNSVSIELIYPCYFIVEKRNIVWGKHQN